MGVVEAGELARRRVGEGELDDPARARRGPALRPCLKRIGPSARRDDVEPFSEVRVVGEAAPHRRRPCGEHVRRASRVLDLGGAREAAVPRRAHDHGSLGTGSVDRFADAGNVLAAVHVARELEAEVDHIDAALEAPPDSARHVRRPADAVLVEDPRDDQLRAVGQPGDEPPVVGALADRRGHVRPVAVLIERDLVVLDEVATLSELAPFEVGASLEALAPAAERDTGVDHGYLRSLGAGPARSDQVPPRPGSVDSAERLRPAVGVIAALVSARQEVPLELLPAGRRALALARVVRNPRRARSPGDVVGHRPPHVGVSLECARGRANAHAGRELDLALRLAAKPHQDFAGDERAGTRWTRLAGRCDHLVHGETGERRGARCADHPGKRDGRRHRRWSV